MVAVVHVGESTLAQRVAEFAATPAGELTVEEFQVRMRQADAADAAALAVRDAAVDRPWPGSA